MVGEPREPTLLDQDSGLEDEVRGKLPRRPPRHERREDGVLGNELRPFEALSFITVTP